MCGCICKHQGEKNICGTKPGLKVSFNEATKNNYVYFYDIKVLCHINTIKKNIAKGTTDPGVGVGDGHR